MEYVFNFGYSSTFEIFYVIMCMVLWYVCFAKLCRSGRTMPCYATIMFFGLAATLTIRHCLQRITHNMIDALRYLFFNNFE